jgi:hypothetical protein
MKRATLVFIALMCLTRIVLAAGVANVTHLTGVLVAKRADGSSRLLAVKSEVEPGDTLSTERNGFARLKFTDGSEVVLRPGTQLKVEKFHFEEARPEADSLALNMLKGGMRAVSGLIGKRNKGAVTYTTPTATIGIRGTHFGALYCHDDCENIRHPGGAAPRNGLYVDVAQGAISVTNSAGTLLLNAGEFGFVGDEASEPVAVPPLQGVQVTMPASISQNAASGMSGNALAGDDDACVVN